MRFGTQHVSVSDVFLSALSLCATPVPLLFLPVSHPPHYLLCLTLVSYCLVPSFLYLMVTVPALFFFVIVVATFKLCLPFMTLLYTSRFWIPLLDPIAYLCTNFTWITIESFCLWDLDLCPCMCVCFLCLGS